MELRHRTLNSGGDGPSRSDTSAPVVVQLGISAKFQSRVSLLRRPITCIKLFFQACYNVLKWISTKWISLSVLIFLASLVLALIFVEIPQSNPFSVYKTDLLTALWWVGLGVIGNLGIGARMPTAFLFLFPHLWYIYTSRMACHGSTFDWRVNVGLAAMLPGRLFACGTARAASSSVLLWHTNDIPFRFVAMYIPKHLFQVFLYALPSFLFWGLGSTLAVLPTYYAALFAKQKRNSKEFRLVKNSIDKQAKSCLLIDASPVTRRFGSVAVFFISIIPCMCNNLGFVGALEGVSCAKFSLATLAGGGILKMAAKCASYAAFFHYELHTELWTKIYALLLHYNIIAFYNEFVVPHVADCTFLQRMHAHIVRCGNLQKIGADSTLERYWTLLLCVVFVWWIVSLVAQLAAIQEELNGGPPDVTRSAPKKQRSKASLKADLGSDAELVATPDVSRSRRKIIRARSTSPELTHDQMTTPRQASGSRPREAAARIKGAAPMSDQLTQSPGPTAVRRSARIRQLRAEQQ